MDNIYKNMNTNINTNISSLKKNVIPDFQKSPEFYIICIFIVFLIIMLYLMLFDVKLSSLNPFTTKVGSSKEQMTADISIIIFVTLLIIGLAIALLPNMKSLRELFGQIGNVTYIILYTILTILFYVYTPKNIIDNYSYIINPIILVLGVFIFYKGTTNNYFEQFNIHYERIKMMIVFYCFITLILAFYSINPGDFASKYFGSSLLVAGVIAVFSFLYLIVLMTLTGSDTKKENLLGNFSSFGTYGPVLFFIFLIVTTFIISSDKKFFENTEKSAGVIILVLIISILWSIILGANIFGDSLNSSADSNILNFFKKGIMALFGLLISALFIYWITFNIEKLSDRSNITSFVLNLLIVIVILGLIYKTINVRMPVGNARKNAFFSLIINTILYIPCLVSGSFDWLGRIISGQYNATEAGSLMMLLIAIGLIVAYLKLPSLVNKVTTQGGNQLVNNPVNSNKIYNLGNYIELNGSDKFDYQYAISFWVFIDAAPPNTNENYNKFTSLLNFGNKPNVLYNAKKNTLMITMKQKDLQDTTKNKLLDFDSEGNRILYVNDNFLLQKWNNIIINSNGGTLDIFLNGELVKSSNEVVPYYTFDSLTIGEDDGIKGGICNVVYFRNALNASNIYYVYNTLKNSTPPILNDSNETILVKNVNLLGSSAKSDLSI